jgi:4-amino-4-deoxy-L-arabinose transferase-like glycosyltransferase
MATEAEGRSSSESASSDPRLSIAALLLGGFLLVLMGQAIYAEIFPPKRWPVYLLILAGLAAFAIAGILIAQKRLPGWLARPARRIADFFSITDGQLVLLLFSPCFALMAGLAAGEKLLALNLPISLGAWLLALASVVVGGYRRGESAIKDFDRRDLLLATGLFLTAFLIRAAAIGEIPPTLSGDEGSAGLVAVRFLSGEADNVFTVGWFSFPSLYFALQSIGILLLGQTIAGLRIISAFGGALTVAALYLLVRTMFGRTSALLASVFLAAFHYHIHFSRIGLNNVWDGFFAVVCAAGLGHGWKSGRRSSFLISGLALGLGQYFYASIRILPLLLLIWAAAAFLFDRETFRRRFADLVMAAFVAFVVALPLLLFFQQHPDEFNAPMERVTVLSGWLEQRSLEENTTGELVILDLMADTALGLTHLPLRQLYDPGSPLLLAGAAGLFLLGLIWAATHPDLRYLLILLPVAGIIVLGGFSFGAPSSQRYVIVAPMVAIILTVPLVEIARWLAKEWPRLRYVALAGAVLVMTWIVVADLRYYFDEVYETYVLGGLNTQVATSVAGYLNEQDPAPEVYFFGFPRMGYYSLSTIPYLAPEVEAQDVMEPLTAPPEWPLTRPTTFVFLPEREEELRYVESAYPGGSTYRATRPGDGLLLFAAYEAPFP